VDHPRSADQGAVGVDDRRTVIAAIAVPLIEVEDDHDAKLGGAGGKGFGHRARDFFGQLPRPIARGALRVEGLEGELCEAHQFCASGGRGLQSTKAALKIVVAVVRGVLLNKSYAHGLTSGQSFGRVEMPTNASLHTPVFISLMHPPN
jgi:hypothetical protein